MTYLIDPQTGQTRTCESCERAPATRVVDYDFGGTNWGALDACPECAADPARIERFADTGSGLFPTGPSGRIR